MAFLINFTCHTAVMVCDEDRAASPAQPSHVSLVALLHRYETAGCLATLFKPDFPNGGLWRKIRDSEQTPLAYLTHHKPEVLLEQEWQKSVVFRVQMILPQLLDRLYWKSIFKNRICNQKPRAHVMCWHSVDEDQDQQVSCICSLWISQHGPRSTWHDQWRQW